MNFKIAVGYNQALVDLDDFVPYQPKTPGIQYIRRSYFPNGDVKDEGPFIVFTFALLDETQYQAMITQAGLLVAKTAEVTIQAQDASYLWVRYNGIAVKPLLGVDVQRNGYHLRAINLRIKRLALIP